MFIEENTGYKSMATHGQGAFDFRPTSEVVTEGEKLIRKMPAIRARLRWVIAAGGQKIEPRAVYWAPAVQSMLALGFVTWATVGAALGVLTVTDAGRRASEAAEKADPLRGDGPTRSHRGFSS
jgi:hypothetical protein